uniref:Si:ch211-247j9.1 n=1 Tax=Oryzias melastigma TaxID=30732 RepID=A0A3B3B6L4_ORYME
MGLSCFKSWKHDRTGHKGNRDVLASPGSYFFLSNSAGQGDEWLKSLNKGIWIPFTGVFGQRLEETVLYERRYGVRVVPIVVEQCVNFIRERGLQEVGLFRQPGRNSLVRELQEAFDSGERPSFDSTTDVHTVASLLKLYLRQLPEPLVPYSCYQNFLFCAQKMSTDRTLGLMELRSLLHELPVANFNLLHFICQFLNEVQSFSSCNKMSVQNLATVFGPNILRAKAEDLQSLMGGAALVQTLMLELIRENESLFTKVPPPINAHRAAGSRASSSALMQPHLQPPPCLRQLSLPLIADSSDEDGHADNSSCIFSAADKLDLSSGQKRRLGHRHTSSHPENCFYPPLSCSPPLQHHSARNNMDLYQDLDGQGPSRLIEATKASLNDQEPDGSTSTALKGWGKAWSGLQDSTAWSSDGTEEMGVVPETASGGSSEAQEDSTPSAYDNLDRASLDPPVEIPTSQANFSEGHVGTPEVEVGKQETKQSTPWSSGEILPFDESSEDVEADTPDLSPKKPQKTEQTGDKDLHNNNNETLHPNSPASCSALSDSPLSTGSSEVFLPSAPPNLQEAEHQFGTKDTHSMVAKLQQQMVQQKTEYQTRIERLERSNDILERQVAVLRLSLEQQRRSQSVAEIKIRNMERAKADADHRNSTLQREMELFFHMYGEIKRRADRGGREAGSI